MRRERRRPGRQCRATRQLEGVAATDRAHPGMLQTHEPVTLSRCISIQTSRIRIQRKRHRATPSMRHDAAVT
jgi:hypothetical protein